MIEISEFIRVFALNTPYQIIAESTVLLSCNCSEQCTEQYTNIHELLNDLNDVYKVDYASITDGILKIYIEKE